ncbi:hypothetical protein SD436_07825 [Streptococcus sp. 2A/TPW/M5]
MGSTTLISSAFTALLNCAEVGRRNRILNELPISVPLSLGFKCIHATLDVGHIVALLFQKLASTR